MFLSFEFIFLKVFFAFFKALISSSVEGVFNFWINYSASLPFNVGVGFTFIAINLKPPFYIFDLFNYYWGIIKIK